MLELLLTLIHVIVCFVLIGVVLLQTGKRADLAGAFGGGGSQTAFGARGAATVLSRATTISAVVFMITSLSLALLQSSQRGGSTLPLESAPATTAPISPAPATDPVPAPAQGETKSTSPEGNAGAAPDDQAPPVPPTPETGK